MRPPASTLFPYTTLFRSPGVLGGGQAVPEVVQRDLLPLVRGRERGPTGRAGRRAVRGRDQAEHLSSRQGADRRDRKSTRLNSSHSSISYAVFCWKRSKIE